MDTEGTVEQVLQLVEVYCEIVRITAPTVREAANLENIKNSLIKKGCDVPLVADIHFRPDAAMLAAEFVEKVRINPGNFTDGKAFKVLEYTDKQYESELNRIEDRFTPLVLKLKKLGRALRIGTNHGSLSDRIMNRFGDSPLGMVESALEFVRICRKNDYHDIILSMKSSNPKVMVAAYRLLAQRMDQEGMDYPFHLGVTEAGDGEDGRIKSAVGIGSLLEDGIGDTIRVSLTEDPEREVPVAYEIAKKYEEMVSSSNASEQFIPYVDDPIQYEKTITPQIQTGPITLGGQAPVRIISRLRLGDHSPESLLELLERRVKTDTPPEIIEIPFRGESFDRDYNHFRKVLDHETRRLAYWISVRSGDIPDIFNFDADGFVVELKEPINEQELEILATQCKKMNAVLVLRSDFNSAVMKALEFLKGKNIPLAVGVGGESHPQFTYRSRMLVAQLRQHHFSVPIIIFGHQAKPTVVTATHIGNLLCDGIGDAIRVSIDAPTESNLDFGFNLLQACGNRITKTEYVSCPSCGRTLFNLQETTERIKSKTNHLKGVKIAIMGCIVNGPGEMADADFGYVGGGPNKINLYVGKTCVQKSIPTAQADEKLIELIKSHGKWTDPS